MAELFEYALVVLASALFAGASVATYSGFSAFQDGILAHGAFARISGLAEQAAVNGSSEASLQLPAGVLSCESRTLALKVGSDEVHGPSPSECSFEVAVPRGVDSVRFFDRSGVLTVVVS